MDNKRKFDRNAISWTTFIGKELTVDEMQASYITLTEKNCTNFDI